MQNNLREKKLERRGEESEDKKSKSAHIFAKIDLQGKKAYSFCAHVTAENQVKIGAYYQKAFIMLWYGCMINEH